MGTDLSINERRQALAHARRVVIKLGTAVLIREEGGIAEDRLASFVGAVAKLREEGREVLLVSSGAVGLGFKQLRLPRRPHLLPLKQACAAVGQGRLMALYSQAFDKLGIDTAQVLLTEEDFSNRRRYLNLRSTLTKLLELNVVPIINENDTVSTAELEAVDQGSLMKVNFGDNDKLSALVASKIEADLLLMLTDVEGLYTANPNDSSEARLVPVVEEITPEVEALVDEGRSAGGPKLGRGGMRTKIEAARIATRTGCAAVIASGKLPDVIARVFAGEDLGTLFLPKPGLRGRRRWIAFATTIKAAIVVNEGARRALVERKASLLAAGVVEVRGAFRRGDVVSVFDEQEREFARGIVNYSSADARKISGLRSDRIDELVEDRNYDALITRDNLYFHT
ncbi:MAG TPA: glutamate 5-kinase [Blastocatellia bacterium]|nr:glutamate 5-kinase [Blastocatellia bacterium]